jgi:sigma-B regulation protein RsbU (phosphoserine phosphatase)
MPNPSLSQELTDLRIAKVALEAQNQMLENLLRMAETPELEHMLTVSLKQAIAISTELTAANWGYIALRGSRDIIFEIDPAPPEQVLFAQSLQDWGNLRLSDMQIITGEECPCIADAVGSAIIIPICKNKTQLGYITLIHADADHFNPATAALMQAVTKQIALAIEYARFYGQLELHTHMLRLEIEKGRQIQQDFLPAPLVQHPGWETVAFFQPARRVAGDFYDTFQLPGGAIALVVGDVCDKGVGAALFMGLFRSLLRIFSGLHPQTGKVSTDLEALDAVRLTNQYIAENHSQLCMFATIFFGVLDPVTGRLDYINAGHEAPIVVRQAGQRERLKSTGNVVGAMPNAQFRMEQTQLEPGDILLAYSDGVPDARSCAHAFFTERKLLSLVQAPATSVTGLLEHLQMELLSHIGDADPFDDITILAVQRLSN